MEADSCHLQEPKVENAQMRTQCDAFCEGQGVSLLIGSQTYGFSLSASEEICLPPLGVLKHDPEKLRECGSWSSAFREIEVKTSQFIAQLTVFRATQSLYVATLRNITSEIQAYVASQEFAVTISRAVDKVGVLTAAVKERLEAASTALVESDLRKEIATLRLRATALQASLGTNIPLIERFLSECNDLHVGVGPSGEYLLDICAQENAACLENPQSGHVTCCCAYHPFSSFGNVPPAALINGIAGFEGWARVAAGRLLQGEGEGVLDICAESWTEAAPKVAEIYAKVSETGESDVVTARAQAMKAQYGSAYCGFPLDAFQGTDNDGVFGSVNVAQSWQALLPVALAMSAQFVGEF
ncbi:unnamed protein product [Symbiodinium pilosum]|uniref:Uncharacterized protein n=1 Tax=Symbiodinium pilosum TaxID=2952 RepID=A0A812R0J1_SYMPI|nr:unnamed protein product [Symbiodinium pilosum]